jgi:hypothetical protein
MVRAYRANHPTLALFLEDGRHVARTIPAGARVMVEGESMDSEQVVDVMWDGRNARIFAHDLHSRFLPLLIE